MEFKFRATRDEPSSYDPPPLPPPQQPHYVFGSSYFADHPLPAGYICPDVGRAGDYFPNPRSVPESFLRELEKQQIRKEIIAAEAARRCQLEAEVRTEMMIERKMELRGTHANDFPMFSGSSTMVLNHRLSGLNQSEGISMDPLLFTHDSEVKIAEVKATSEAENGRIILLPKPEENISGVKRKAVTPPPTTATMPSINLMKKPKGLLKCELCQVFATSREALKEHFQGKKHKSKESRQSSLIPGKNFVIGMLPRKGINNPSKPVAITSGESLVLEAKPTDGVFGKNLIVEQKNDDKILQLNENSKEDIKNDEGVSEKVGKDSLTFSFWCEMCKIGAFTEAVMNAHMRGKKHTSQFQLLEALDSRAAMVSHSEKVPETAVEKKVTKAKDDVEGSKNGEKMESH